MDLSYSPWTRQSAPCLQGGSMDPIKVEPVTLSGRTVRLGPLAESHIEWLRAAAEDERIWTYMSADARGAEMDRFVATALKARDAGTDLPFAVRLLSDNRIVGSTRYLNIAPAHRRLEIGNTWYAPAVWASQVNPECKLLLLRHARSEEHTSELQSLMRISYAVFCLKKKTKTETVISRINLLD